MRAIKTIRQCIGTHYSNHFHVYDDFRCQPRRVLVARVYNHRDQNVIFKFQIHCGPVTAVQSEIHSIFLIGEKKSINITV